MRGLTVPLFLGRQAERLSTAYLYAPLPHMRQLCEFGAIPVAATSL
jgi:hypothetical protein